MPKDPLETVLMLQILKYLIAGIGLFGAYFQAHKAITNKKEENTWISWGTAAILLYWSFYYTQSILGGLVMSHQIWVRVGVFLSVCLPTARGIEIWKKWRAGRK